MRFLKFVMLMMVGFFGLMMLSIIMLAVTTNAILWMH